MISVSAWSWYYLHDPAPGYWPYFAGSMVLSLFHLERHAYMYIQEEAPARRRAQLFSYAKILGLSGILIVPLVRSFTVVEGSENWRPVLYLPVIVGVIVIILSAFFLKETRAFLIAQQERAAKKAQTGEEEQTPSIFSGLKVLRTISLAAGEMVVPDGADHGALLGLNQTYSEVFMDQGEFPAIATGSGGQHRIGGRGVLLRGLLATGLGRNPAMVIT
jgi:hypothetical protein